MYKEQNKKRTNEMPAITLSAEQKALLNIMENSHQHMYITGRAGAGKSVLLREFRVTTHKRAIVVAPTGIAAINVEGATIHSTFKLPPDVFTKSKGLQENERLSTLLRRTDVLVIDEISMVRADLIDAINERFQQANESEEAFGGAQLLMFGDCYQLPPVVARSLAVYFEKVHGGNFFFNALIWKRCEFKIYELTQVFRQSDPTFKEALNAVRDGTVTDDQIKILNSRYGVKVPTEGTVTLAPTNALVTKINQTKLDQLKEKNFTYRATITGNMKQSAFPTEEFLQLKVGAQIVMLKNSTEGKWVNGTVGKIEELTDESIKVNIKGTVYTLEPETWDETKYTYDPETQKIEQEVVSSFTQYPIRLAWALTIHKSQGQTYESVEVDLTTATFAPGQLYVALSRATSLEGLYLKRPIKREYIMTDAKVVDFMSRREDITEDVIVVEADYPETSKELVTIEAEPVASVIEIQEEQPVTGLYSMCTGCNNVFATADLTSNILPCGHESEMLTELPADLDTISEKKAAETKSFLTRQTLMDEIIKQDEIAAAAKKRKPRGPGKKKEKREYMQGTYDKSTLDFLADAIKNNVFYVTEREDGKGKSNLMEWLVQQTPEYKAWMLQKDSAGTDNIEVVEPDPDEPPADIPTIINATTTNPVTILNNWHQKLELTNNVIAFKKKNSK